MQNGTSPKLHFRSLTLHGVHSPVPSTIHSSPSSPPFGIPNTPESTMRAFLGFQNVQSVPWSLPGLAQVPEARKSAITLLWCQRFLETWSIAFHAVAPRALDGLLILQHT